MLPTTLNKLDVQSCKDLQKIAAGDLPQLTRLIIKKCPALEELPSLARVSCLEQISIDSCEKLKNISGVEELHESVYVELCYCSNTLIRNCIQKLQNLPSVDMGMTGRAVDGAESSLSANLFCEANNSIGAVIEIGTENTNILEWSGSEFSFVIGCFVVVVDSSISLDDINDSLLWCSPAIRVREGESIFTLAAPHCSDHSF